MAKLALINRNEKRKKLVAKYAKRREALRKAQSGEGQDVGAGASPLPESGRDN